MPRKPWSLDLPSIPSTYSSSISASEGLLSAAASLRPRVLHGECRGIRCSSSSRKALAV